MRSARRRASARRRCVADGGATFLQPGKAAACRPAASLSTPGSFLTRSSDSAACVRCSPFPSWVWLSEQRVVRGLCVVHAHGCLSPNNVSELSDPRTVCTGLWLQFMSELQLLCPSQLLGFAAGVKSGKKSLPCSFFFVSFWSVLSPPPPDTGGHTTSFDSSCTLLQEKLSHNSAKPPSECEGTENAVGAGLSSGTLHWLGCLKVQRLCADIQFGLGLQFCRKLI